MYLWTGQDFRSKNMEVKHAIISDFTVLLSPRRRVVCGVHERL